MSEFNEAVRTLGTGVSSGVLKRQPLATAPISFKTLQPSSNGRARISSLKCSFVTSGSRHSSALGPGTKMRRFRSACFLLLFFFLLEAGSGLMCYANSADSPDPVLIGLALSIRSLDPGNEASDVCNGPGSLAVWGILLHASIIFQKNFELLRILLESLQVPSGRSVALPGAYSHAPPSLSLHVQKGPFGCVASCPWPADLLA